MKQLIYITLFASALFFTCNKSFGKNPKPDSAKTSVCLEVTGIAVDEKGRPINGVEVKLYKENDELEWSEITNIEYHEHTFVFKMDVNEYYTIEISKPGYIKRLVGISTKLPASVSYKEIFHHQFEVTLLKEKTGMDDFYLDFPVALIRYDAKRDVFDNSYLYTNRIKAKMMEPENSILNKSVK